MNTDPKDKRGWDKQAAVSHLEQPDHQSQNKIRIFHGCQKNNNKILKTSERMSFY